MARIRSVKPELRRDLTVADWPRDVRYAWVLLWGYLDDSGRGLDDLRLLVADLFPLDRDVTERKLDGWLKKMASDSIHGSAPLCRYEVDGRRYLHAPKWDRSQRVSHPQPSKIPPCPTHEADANHSGATPEPNGTHSRTTPELFRPSRAPEGLGVKGSRGQGVKGVGVAPAPGSAVATRPEPAGTSDTHTQAEHLVDAAGAAVPTVRRRLIDRTHALLAAGTPPAAVTAALTEWHTRDGAAPGLLDDLTQDQLRRAHGAGGRPRPSTTDTAVTQSLRRAAELRAQEASA